MRFDDVNGMLRAFGKGTPSIVSVAHYDLDNRIVFVKGTYANMTEVIGLQEGENYILERRQYSPTLTFSMDKLVEMNAECRLFLVKNLFI